MHREAKQFPQGHTASKRQRWAFHWQQLEFQSVQWKGQCVPLTQSSLEPTRQA